jgi:hypothetical protein
VIIFNIRYYNEINMKKGEIKKLGISIGANRAEIKGDDVIFIFNVATTEDMQEQDCVSSVYSQAEEILKEAGLTINSVKVDKFNAENNTNEVKLVCIENKDINKEYDDMEKKVMNDSVNNIKKQLNNPWLSQETKDELREKLYDIQQENKVKKLKDSTEKPNRLAINDPYNDWDHGWGRVQWKTDKDGWCEIGYANKKTLEFSADLSHCPQEAIDYFSKNGWKIENTHIGPAEMDTHDWEYDEFDVYWKGIPGSVADGNPQTKELFPYKECPQEVIDYFIKLGYTIDKKHHLGDSIGSGLSIHEMAALAFYLSYDVGFHFDELRDYYPDEEDVDTAYYKDIRYHERNNDRAFFEDVMKAYYPSKEEYEDILKDALRDYESYGRKKKIIDAGVYRTTNTGKSKWYSNVKEEREALPGAWRYHTPGAYPGGKKFNDLYFSIDNFEQILSDYLTSHERGEAHHKDIYAPSYEAVIGAVLGKDRLKQLLNNVAENTKFAEKKFYRRYPGTYRAVQNGTMNDPQIVRDYLTNEDLVRMLRPEEKEKVINFLRWRPAHYMTKEQQKAYEMVHPKEQDLLHEDINKAQTQEKTIKENNNSKFTQLIRAYNRTGKGNYQDEIKEIIGSQRWEDVLRNDAEFLPQLHFQRLTKEEQDKLLDFFRKETQES